MRTSTPAPARLAVDSRPVPPTSALFRSVAAATLVAAALRLFRLGHQSLWIDEVFTWQSAGAGAALTWRDLLENVHGPLYSLVLHAWMGVAGSSEWALRAPSAVAGILTVPAMAWLAARWLGREVAAPAAWLAAGSPFLVWYSQETRNYACLVLWAVVATAALLEARRRPAIPVALGAAGAMAAALLTNLAFLLLLPLELRLWLGGDPGTRRRRLALLGALAAALALVLLPWLPHIASTWDWSRLGPRHAGPGEVPLRGSMTFHVAAVPFALHAFAVGYTLGPSLRELRVLGGTGALAGHWPELATTGLLFGLLGLLALVALARRGRLADAALWCLAPTLAVSYFAIHNFKVFHPRYIAISLPCVLIAAAAALVDLGPLARRGFAAAIAALWAVSLYHHYFVPAYGREDYRGALAAVRAGIRPGERVLATGCEEPVDFYGRGLRVVDWWLGFSADPVRMRLRFDEATAGAGGTWVVLSRSEDLDPQDHFARWLSSRYPGAERLAFSGVRVWHVKAQDLHAPAEADRPRAAAP